MLLSRHPVRTHVVNQPQTWNESRGHILKDAQRVHSEWSGIGISLEKRFRNAKNSPVLASMP